MQEAALAIIEALNLGLLGPELWLAFGAAALAMIGTFTEERSATQVTGLSIAVIVAAFIWLLFASQRGEAMGDGFILDDFAWFMKLMVLAGSGIAIVMSVNYMRQEEVFGFEFPVMIVAATLGMSIMISANDLIALYLGLELQSVALCVLAAINRRSPRSTDGGIKYFTLGALSSCLFLYGASLIYGFTGHTDFNGIAEALTGTGRSLGLILGLVFLVCGLAFKISAVPFHGWTSDVHFGAPTPITAFFAVAPKIAAIAILMRILVSTFEAATPDWQQIVAFLAIASVLLSAFAAIGQTNIKRFMAYSSIGHMGFALVGLSAGTQAGVTGVILYLLIYLVMTIGVFAVIIAMRRREGMVAEITNLSGMSKNNPPMALFLTLLLLSMAGAPPLAGFFAKYFVFMAAVEAGLYGLAITGALASVIHAFCYLRIVKIIWVDDPAEGFLRMAGELRIVMIGTGLFVVLFALIAGPVIEATSNAAASLF